LLKIKVLAKNGRPKYNDEAKHERLGEQSMIVWKDMSGFLPVVTNADFVSTIFQK